MRKLFLTSAGIVPDVEKDFLKFLGGKFAGLKVGFISTAANLTPDAWWVINAHERLANLGFHISEIDIEKIQGKLLKEKLEDQDIIYVCGGNTFYLLKHARDSGFSGLLPGLLDSGRIYVGESAGSIVVGPDIEIAGWDFEADENVFGLTDLKGLSLVPFGVFVHFEPGMLQLVKEEAMGVGYKVYVLSNRQAIRVTDDNFEVVGYGDPTILN